MQMFWYIQTLTINQILKMNIDHRDIANRYQWWDSLSPSCSHAKPKQGYFEDEPESIPIKLVVCDSCGGVGHYVNPSIDAHGIGADEWNDWDYEDRQAYLDGRYDVTCECCDGNKVMPEPREQHRRDELDDYFQGMYEIDATYAAERAMGA